MKSIIKTLPEKKKWKQCLLTKYLQTREEEEEVKWSWYLYLVTVTHELNILVNIYSTRVNFLNVVQDRCFINNI